MQPTNLLGIDIGTQGTKAVLFDRRGRTLAAAFRKSRLHRPAPGVVEEDPEYQFKTVCQCIKSCVSQAGIAAATIAAVGIDGQMAGILGVGADGRHVTPYDSWLDTRCSNYIVQMQQQAGEEIIRRTGGPASFNHGPKILWWRQERPRTYEQIAAFVQPGGYAAMRLCAMDATAAFIDKSYLHFSGFADNLRRTVGRTALQTVRSADSQAAADRRFARGDRSRGGQCRSALWAAGRLSRDRRLRRHGGFVSRVRGHAGRACASTWRVRPPCLRPPRDSSRPTHTLARWVGANRRRPACGIPMRTSMAAA